MAICTRPMSSTEITIQIYGLLFFLASFTWTVTLIFSLKACVLQRETPSFFDPILLIIDTTFELNGKKVIEHYKQSSNSGKNTSNIDIELERI